MEIVLIHQTLWLMGNPNVSASIFHDFLHTHVDVVTLGGIGLTKTFGIELIELRIGPAFPVPDADLVLDVPLSHLAGVR